jgi:hypothetical protein
MTLPPLSPTARTKEEKGHVTDETALVKIQELRRLHKTDIGTIAKFREELEKAKIREDKLKGENEELRETYKTLRNIDHETELDKYVLRESLLEAQNEYLKHVASLKNEMNTENGEDMLEAEHEAPRHRLASLEKKKRARKKARKDEKSSIEEDRLKEFLYREEANAAETTGMIPLDSFLKLRNAFFDTIRELKELSEECAGERKKRKVLQKQWKEYLEDPSRTDKPNYKIRWMHLSSKTAQPFDKEDTVAVEGTAENEMRKQEEVSGHSQKPSESPHEEILDCSLPSDRPLTTEKKMSRNNDSTTTKKMEKENFVPLEGNNPSSVVETSIGPQTTEKPDSNRFSWVSWSLYISLVFFPDFNSRFQLVTVRSTLSLAHSLAH